MAIELLKYIAISGTAMTERFAQISGALIGIAFVYVIIKALTTRTEDEKRQKEEKRQNSKFYNSRIGKAIRRYIPFIIISVAIIIALMLAD